jgi:hypothetical protein
MEPLGQTLVVCALVAACAVYAIRSAIRAFTGRKTGCGCAECPALTKPPTQRGTAPDRSSDTA